jgi:hypothetical protein
MDRFKFLLILGLLFGLTFSLGTGGVAFGDTSCQPAGTTFGSCSGAQTSTNSVDVWARTITPGRTVIQPGSNTVGVLAQPGARSIAPIVAPWRYIFCMGVLKIDNVCKPVAPATPTPVAPAVVVYDPVDLADLANFSPQSISLTSQPAGWGVLGLPVNFIASSSTHVVSGSLFGQVAEVRFTPRTFDWSFGDGTSGTSSFGGSRWDQQGLPDFSNTATSHTYAQAGNFTTRVSVRYGVEYRIGGGAWTAVAGDVIREAATTLVVVLNADTVLTTGDCLNAQDVQSCL